LHKNSVFYLLRVNIAIGGNKSKLYLIITDIDQVLLT